MKIQEYTKVVRYIEYDGIKFYPDKRGYWLGKIHGQRNPVRLHVYVWEKANGPIPPGYDVHHIDGNPDNNELENLRLMTEHDHIELHNSLQVFERRRWMEEVVRPAAIRWHKSAAAKEFHWMLSHKGQEAIHSRLIPKTCEFCGKEFEAYEALGYKQRFCSNTCKSAYRRKVGIDNVEYPCEWCGNPIWTNKYAPKRFCSDACRAAHNKQRWEEIMLERGKNHSDP